MLSLPSEVSTLLASGRFALRWLLRFDLDGGAQGLWNDTYQVTVDAVVYSPLAGNMVVAPADASSQLDVNQLTVTVTNLLSAVTGLLDGVEWHQRPVTLYLAFLDDSGAIIHTLPRFSGFLDAITIQDSAGGTATAVLTIESNNRELSRVSGRTRSDADQRAVSANDGFFKYTTAANTDVSITWGKGGPQYPVRPL